jgi:hypothetical protein
MVVPLSTTIRLFLLEIVIPSGPSRPEINSVTGHCAQTGAAASSAQAKAATDIVAERFRGVLFGVFISMGPFSRLSFFPGCWLDVEAGYQDSEHQLFRQWTNLREAAGLPTGRSSHRK